MKTKNGLTISLSNQKLGGFIPSVNLPPRYHLQNGRTVCKKLLCL